MLVTVQVSGGMWDTRTVICFGKLPLGMVSFGHQPFSAAGSSEQDNHVTAVLWILVFTRKGCAGQKLLICQSWSSLLREAVEREEGRMFIFLIQVVKFLVLTLVRFQRTCDCLVFL